MNASLRGGRRPTKQSTIVIPAKAGIQNYGSLPKCSGAALRRSRMCFNRGSKACGFPTHFWRRTSSSSRSAKGRIRPSGEKVLRALSASVKDFGNDMLKTFGDDTLCQIASTSSVMLSRNDNCLFGQMMANQKKGKLIIISAPSGCGKTTIVDELLKRNKNLIRSISYTTRSPRTGEVSGRDYFFISREEFLEKKKHHFFLESAEVFGQHYGTSKDFVMSHTHEGRNVVLAIDVHGMKQLKEKGRQDLSVTSIFIMPPSEEILRNRLENRKTETKEEIAKRLEVAHEEMRSKPLYDFVIVNHEVDQAVESIEEMIQ